MLILTPDSNKSDKQRKVTAAEDFLIIPPTTGNAASVMSKLEDWLQTEWPELKVFLTSVTEQFATISINGPFATNLIQKKSITPNDDGCQEYIKNELKDFNFDKQLLSLIFQKFQV